jgi:hypothetical protein
MFPQAGRSALDVARMNLRDSSTALVLETDPLTPAIRRNAKFAAVDRTDCDYFLPHVLVIGFQNCGKENLCNRLSLDDFEPRSLGISRIGIDVSELATKIDSEPLHVHYILCTTFAACSSN